MRYFVVVGALLASSAAALAQDDSGTRVRVGIGGQNRPAAIGADRREWAPLLDLAIQRGPGDFEFEAPDDNFDIRLYSKDGFSVGPVANYQSGRNNRDFGERVGKVPNTIEAGVFAQYQLSEAVRLRGEVRKGVGGHNGLIASFGADAVWRDGDRYVFSAGPRVNFTDSRYQREFFGVSAERSLITGLDEFDPDGGLQSIGATSGVNYQISGPLGLFGFARLERLVGEAAKSPIVRELGSKSQLSAGLGLTYTFTVKR
ncbi:MAG: MipA/OmpV family protein [Sphingomicrobium sp.]